jgi:hypothetical protein
MKSKKIFLLIAATVSIIISAYYLIDYIKCNKFEKRFMKLKLYEPDSVVSFTLEKIKNENRPEGKKILISVLPRFYFNHAEDFTKLIVDILFFQGKLTSREIDKEQIEKIVQEIENNKEDHLNKIIIESFELSAHYYSKGFEYSITVSDLLNNL